MKCDHPVNMIYKIDNYFRCEKCKTNFMKTKKATISITEEEIKQAKQISKELLGSENLSGLFRYWINQYVKARKTK